jgi:two-component system, NarL family, response regulator LiaR
LGSQILKQGNMRTSFFTKNKPILLYGAALSILLFFLKWIELKFVLINHALEIYIGLIALTFTGLGIWVALKLTTPKVKTVVVEKEVFLDIPPSVFSLNNAEIKKLGISNREMEVLQLMAQGLSNQEIAAQLFVSLNTIKTHTTHIFEKLDVSRRTQAVEKAKRLRIIP